MPEPVAHLKNAPRALVLTPELPALDRGGGPLRIASLVEYLSRRYAVDVVTFAVRPHSKGAAARWWRNAIRLLLGRPPLFDRYSGYERQLLPQLAGKSYEVAVVEHFWCATYAPLLRAHSRRLALDLHNVESELARSHAQALPVPSRWAWMRFAALYRELEREWLPRYDILLVTSDEDRKRVAHIKPPAAVRLFPNALPALPIVQDVVASHCIVFSGNLEYHPNVEAVRWFRAAIWPLIRDEFPDLTWTVIGRNEHAIRALVEGDPRIVVTGPVPDAVAALAAGKVCVVPLLSGSGTRFKILEAWAAGRAVVSTSLGAEGLGGIDGRHLIIADEATAFAAAIIRLLHDADLRQRLGAAGRKLYEDRFTWTAAWRMLDETGGL